MTKSTDEKLYDIFASLNRKKNKTNATIKPQKIAIISTPRCGSSLFCDLLANTGQLGDPKEWINMRYISAYSRYFKTPNIDLGKYLKFVIEKTTTNNGCFSINFHISQFIEMHKKGFNVFDLGFDHIYFLSRNDKLAQAYSLAKAQITDQWSSSAKPIKNITGKIPHSAILKSLLHLTESEEFYHAQLKQHVTTEFVYEDFRNINQTDAFKQILIDCGAEASLALQTDYIKQAANEEPDELISLRKILGLSSD